MYETKQNKAFNFIIKFNPVLFIKAKFDKRIGNNYIGFEKIRIE